MEDKKSCHKCDKSTNFSKVTICKKSKKPLCKECCIKESGGLKQCIDWNFCWPTYYM